MMLTHGHRNSVMRNEIGDGRGVGFPRRLTAFLSALVPQSAVADLFNRALALQFGAGSVPKLEPE
jgi:hypothetical protein